MNPVTTIYLNKKVNYIRKRFSYNAAWQVYIVYFTLVCFGVSFLPFNHSPAPNGKMASIFA